MADAGRTPEFFHRVYEDLAPWDIGRPQPAVQALQRGGGFAGSILDVGCGTGDNAVWLARSGLRVVGIDPVPRALELARERARRAGVTLELHVGSALELDRLDLGGTFDTALDAGVFHIFEDDERPRYVDALRHVLRPGGWFHTIVFSEHKPAGTGEGPRRVTREELRDSFRAGWREVEIVAERYCTRNAPAGHPSWRATFERTA